MGPGPGSANAVERDLIGGSRFCRLEIPPGGTTIQEGVERMADCGMRIGSLGACAADPRPQRDWRGFGRFCTGGGRKGEVPRGNTSRLPGKAQAHGAIFWILEQQVPRLAQGLSLMGPKACRPKVRIS